MEKYDKRVFDKGLYHPSGNRKIKRQRFSSLPFYFFRKSIKYVVTDKCIYCLRQFDSKVYDNKEDNRKVMTLCTEFFNIFYTKSIEFKYSI